MESGCHHNLNADGRNKHPIRHSFFCFTFKRSPEHQTSLAPGRGEGAEKQGTSVPVLPDWLCIEGGGEGN